MTRHRGPLGLARGVTAFVVVLCSPALLTSGAGAHSAPLSLVTASGSPTGSGSASPTATATPAAMGVDRVAGHDRYETAYLIRDRFYAHGPTPWLWAASGDGWPDALSAGPAAATGNGLMKTSPLFTIPRSRENWAGTFTQMKYDFHPDVVNAAGGTSALSAIALNNLDATSSSGATRYSGPDRYATSAAVVRKAFPSAAPTVFITTGADFPDALSAGAAAASMAAPLLLVSPTAIPAAVATELERLAPGQIYVVGGTSVVSLPVEAALRGFTTSGSTSSVQRISGSDRYATAIAVSQRFFAPASGGQPFLVTGRNYPDALVASALGYPILLCPGNVVSTAVIAEIRRLDDGGVIILGGYAVISQQAEDQLRAALS